MIKLRPHHLLCCVFYEGRGYNTLFIDKMNQIHQKLNDNPIKIVSSCDDICQFCPHHNFENKCNTQEHVLNLDQKVIEYFHIEIGKSYEYHLWKNYLIKTLNENSFKQICGDCSWYKSGVCTIEKLKNHK